MTAVPQGHSGGTAGTSIGGRAVVGAVNGGNGNSGAPGAGRTDAGTGDAGGSGGGAGAARGASGGSAISDQDASTTDASVPHAWGTVTVNVQPTPSKTCNHTLGQLGVPFVHNTGVYAELTTCNLTTGCQPNEYVVHDGAPGTTVSCFVAPEGGNFTVSVALSVQTSLSPQQSLSMQFEAKGTLSPGGGTLMINESNTEANGGGTDDACSVQLPQNASFLDRGKVWAQFTCTHFRDPTDLTETGCTVTGALLFENCSG
jgi:hypothetical protein